MSQKKNRGGNKDKSIPSALSLVPVLWDQKLRPSQQKLLVSGRHSLAYLGDLWLLSSQDRRYIESLSSFLPLLPSQAREMFTCVILEKASYHFIFIFMCMDALPSCVFLLQCPQRSEEGVRSSGTGITTVSHHMGARNQTQIL